MTTDKNLCYYSHEIWVSEYEDECHQLGSLVLCLPIIVVNVVIHIAGVAAIHSKVAPILSTSAAYGRLTNKFAVATSVVVVALMGLHLVEGMVWASS